MPNPQPRDLHVDALLTQISLAYKNPLYIADMIFPVVGVKKQSDIVPKYDQSHWFRDGAELRAPGTKSRGGGFTVDTTDKYFCDRFSFRGEIPDDTRDNADAPFNMDRDMTEFVTDKVLLRREVAFATDFFKTGVWSVDKTGGADFPVWSDYANSSPLIDLTTFNDDIEARIGREGNILTMGKQVWNALKWHPDLMETIKYTQRAQMTLELFASLVEVPKVLVGRALRTTSVEGTAEASVVYSRIWGKHALLLYTPDRPSLLTPAAGYCFTWSRVPNSLTYIKRYRDDERETDIIESNTNFDQKVTAARAGEFLSGAVA